MKMQLTENIFVESDSYQYILKESRTSEKGKSYERVLGYYGTIRHLARGLIEKEIKSEITNDITDLVKHLDDLETEIANNIEVGHENEHLN